MKTTKLTRFVLSAPVRTLCMLTLVVAIFLGAIVLLADPPADGRLKVMRMGLGTGTVTSSPAGIDCGGAGPCELVFPSSPDVELTATADPTTSSFAGWDVDADADPATVGDCTGMTNPCRLTMNAHRFVRPVFNRLTPVRQITVYDTTTRLPSTRVFGATDVLAANEVIRPEDVQAYLTANLDVDTPAEFVAALLPEFKLNWILMSRSESLQTGTAASPRILLPSADARFVFTIGMRTHSSYPGAHPNAIEYMQWDADQKNFRFHEIVLFPIDPMDPDGDGVGVIPRRPREVRGDDDKCPKCHSTRNIPGLNRAFTPPRPAVGTDGLTPGSIQVKNKPNWDAYDSWAGMMPFNRDRIYQGSVEAASFRKFFNPWTWETNESARTIIEQLRLQPPGVPSAMGNDHRIRRQRGGPSDGHVRFGFDPPPPPLVTVEPSPPSSGSGDEAPITTNYSFDRAAGSGATSTVTRGGTFLTLHHTFNPIHDEGRAVHFFDLLSGQGTPVPPDTGFSNLNSQRVANELINHRYATGSVEVDVRPVVLAIANQCLNISGTTVTSTPAHSIDLTFFDRRNGMGIAGVFADTETRAKSLTRRKADLQRFNLHRDVPEEVYKTGADPIDGLIPQYSTLPATTPGIFDKLRQEIFRRPTRARPCPVLLCPDDTVMDGIYVDRELYAANTEQVALYRYFLEPLGVSVDKWSMGVRGRSRTYTFADVFGIFENTLIRDVQATLGCNPDIPATMAPCQCGATLINSVNDTLRRFNVTDDPGATPKYTDVQRIFNKNCIECHGGLDYPPYQNYGRRLDLSEDEAPPAGRDRLDRSWALVVPFANRIPEDSFIFDRITDYQMLNHPYNPTEANEDCPFGLMPCAGPPLSGADIETVRRWIQGDSLNSRGDTHIQTTDGVNYDFQSAGEFVLLRGQGMEIQARQTAVATDGPLGPSPHTELRSCASVNTAVAVRIGDHRITYQPNSSGEPDPKGLQLRVDGELKTLGTEMLLSSGGRIIPTPAPGGIQIEAPGGTAIIITPSLWEYYQVWYLDIAANNARATDGVSGAMAPGSWLPALPDGSSLGPKPDDLHQRYVDLYDRFENAWRVTDANTLFDYAPGTSTATFTIESWPEEYPQSCTVPPRTPGGPIAKAALRALPLDVARQHCAPIVAEAAKKNCEQDVMATGEPSFAQTYIRAEQVQQNGYPATPVLGFPERFKTDVDAGVNFTWNTTRDLEGDPLVYKHCVWPVTEQFTLNYCAVTPGSTTSWRRPGGNLYLLLLVLICLALVILVVLAVRRQPALVSLAAIAILAGAAVILAFYIGKNRTSSGMLARSVSGLQSGQAYYWKVIVEDGKGGTTESEVRRFDIK